MKALVISDTHVKRKEDIDELREILEPYVNSVDIIIHAGDSVTEYLVDYLRSLKPTRIVSGNMDMGEVARMLPEKEIFDFGRFRIGLTHGWGPSSGLKERVLGLFKSDNVDAVIFGHSHQPFLGKRDGILILNPGSPTDTRFADRNTIAILEGNAELEAKIIDLAP